MKAIIGANYGDEGKGQSVHRIIDPRNKTCVVRFNSGAQAGHTVVAGSDSHVFHQYGSGSFKGADTFLSREVVVNPYVIQGERTTFPNQQLFIDSQCRITTLPDMVINQLIENERRSARHGSCGMGFNETIERNNKRTGVRISDIDSSVFGELMYAIWEDDGPDRLIELGYRNLISKYFDVLNAEMIKASIVDAETMFSYSTIVTGLTDLISQYDDFVFEGAQGLLLSERNTYDFPHLTRSDTGVGNIITLVNSLPSQHIPNNVDVRYVSRPYVTRHGAGPLPLELDRLPLDTIVDSTNVPNPYQGTIRYGLLDVDELAKRVIDDFDRCPSWGSCTIQLTCADQVPDRIHYFSGGTMKYGTVNMMAEAIMNNWKINTVVVGLQ